MSFLNRYTGDTLDGENWVAIQPVLDWECSGGRFRLRIGATTDGPSIPHRFASIIPRTGKHWLPGVAHDGGYRNQLEQWNGDNWISVTLNKEQCDRMFHELLISNGVDKELAFTFYEAVRLFGQESFNQDRNIK